MRIQDKRLLQGMDQDASNEFIKNVFYRSANNVVINDNESGSEGVMSNIKGNRNDVFEEISSSYGTDGTDNECVGTVSVPELETIFVFKRYINN